MKNESYFITLEYDEWNRMLVETNVEWAFGVNLDSGLYRANIECTEEDLLAYRLRYNIVEYITSDEYHRRRRMAYEEYRRKHGYSSYDYES